MAAILNKINLHKKPEKLENIVFGGLIITMLVFFVRGCFMPQQVLISKTKSEVEAMTQEMQGLEEVQKQILEEEKKETMSGQEGNQNPEDQIISSKEELEKFDRTISGIFEKSPVTIGTIVIQEPQKEGRLMRHPIELTFSGNYAAIGFVLEQLETAKPTLVIQSVSMIQKQQQAREPIIETTIKGSFYGKWI